MLKCITQDNNVDFWWSMLAIDISSNDAAAQLLSEIVEMWVSIRGFSLVMVGKIIRVQRNKVLRKARVFGRVCSKK